MERRLTYTSFPNCGRCLEARNRAAGVREALGIIIEVVGLEPERYAGGTSFVIETANLDEEGERLLAKYDQAKTTADEVRTRCRLGDLGGSLESRTAEGWKVTCGFDGQEYVVQE